ncbi:calmodulin-regulated spectrin-associated protein 2a isoform X2 [Latimeria chalumnae]|uniref:calmodulin-regulated spectrin-associated protein 2a isoform X2 n=1 Tax=Latimeria chalumnae TaxID=7897 RepID=UPI0003C114E7|nr:PREDICTED: calmodulin-regulated spectrin-associated protein 2 isoform X2 [Latimeria chalumnae]|eukprot:XP_005997782.1 PREDICTED: calmodulin-regulated spectrin-associated protein 2 isoform X2 [Latimeria chalumnae]
MGDAADNRDVKKTFIVPAIKPFDHYDFARAKIACSLAWLVAKAFGTDSVPEDLREPFYTDQYDQEHIKPPVVNLLLSAELYCRAGSLILKSDAAKPLVGHDAVIQALAQRGLYVTDQEKLVTERDLCKKPIQMSAHLAMVDTLMMAYTAELVSIEKVVACIQQYTAFFLATELPYDIEDAVMTWLNKVNGHLKEIIEEEQKFREPQGQDVPGVQKARYRKEQTLLRQIPCIPLVENLLKDTTDGCALAALIHFYCPDIVKMEDICLKETMSLADSLYNLQLIQEFCQEYLNHSCHFTLEDLLYAASSIKSNYLVFMAELFWWFEVVKPPFVQPRVVVDPQAESVLPLNSMPAASISNTFAGRFTDDSCSSDLNTSKISPAVTPSESLLPLAQQENPPPVSGSIRRSTSLSYMDGCVGTWPKEKRTSFHGVSFDIPFEKERNLQTTTPQKKTMTRSISNEGLALNFGHLPKNIRKNLSYQAVNGQNEIEGIGEELCPFNNSTTDPRATFKKVNENYLSKPQNGPVQKNTTILDDCGNQIGTPSIEEALQIIHDNEKSHGGLSAEQVSNGFFLHSQDVNNFNSKPEINHPGFFVSSSDYIAETKGAMSPSTDNTEVDTGIHVPSEDIQETMDEDSSLRDYTVSMDSDLEEPSKFHQDFDMKAISHKEPTSPYPSSVIARAQLGANPGVKMTSFAEQKFKKRNQTDGRSSGSSSQTTPESSELNIPNVVAWAQTPEEVRQGRDATHLLASEVVQLRMKLEEKRRAIEAQKKKVEAAFTKQRQKMGRTAFLTVVKKKGDGISPLREEAVGAEDERAFTEDKEGKRDKANKVRSARGNEESTNTAHVGWLKSPTTPVEAEKQWNLASPLEETMAETDIIEYARSIEKLNSSLNFLQQEMQRLATQQEMLMQMREQQAWVISPPQPSPQKQVQELRSSSRSTGSLSPVLSGDTPRPSYRSPQSSNRKSGSFSSKTPRTPRPNELKLTPLNRTLTPPQSVDSLPRLRRFSPSQTQTRSFVCLGDSEGSAPGMQLKHKVVDADYKPVAVEMEKNSEMPSEACVEEEIRPVESNVSEVLSQPIKETVCLTPNNEQYLQSLTHTLKNVSLIEVSLSELKPPEDEDDQDEKDVGDSSREPFDEDQKMCCGFFFKDDQKGDGDMAMKRAAFLEKRLKREKENQLRKQQMEAELEEKKEEAKRKAEEERQKKEDERARREYIKQEYLRRKQLKLMEEMDIVLKPRTNTSKSKKPRPKSIHRDQMESPKTPVRGPPVSSLSLASLNTGDNDSVHSGKKTPRAESVEGFLSPSCSGSRNGEKDWENGSTTSSVASATEYTGPKLYKEPSAKSNKHIIQNALAHCCLAGRVNEAQKKKILEEMEKSEANNFLILFRDSGCQFRSLYTYCPEMEEISKLVGIGPKSITKKMIEGLYKYNSDRKQFSHIPAKTLSASVDAITIHGHLWQTKRPVTPKKVLPTKA